MTSKGENLIKFAHTSSDIRYSMEDADWAINDLLDGSVNGNSPEMGSDSLWHRYSNVHMDNKTKNRLIQKLKAMFDEEN